MKNTYKIRLGIAFIIIYILFYYSVLLFGPESHISVISSNLLSVAGAFISSTVLFYSYRKSVTSDKVIWFWFAAGTFTYFIGDLIWMYQESILHRT
ncbi:hypothetical protein, partial [Streptomyces sp. NPDC015350]